VTRPTKRRRWEQSEPPSDAPGAGAVGCVDLAGERLTGAAEHEREQEQSQNDDDHSALVAGVDSEVQSLTKRLRLRPADAASSLESCDAKAVDQNEAVESVEGETASNIAAAVSMRCQAVDIGSCELLTSEALRASTSCENSSREGGCPPPHDSALSSASSEASGSGACAAAVGDGEVAVVGNKVLDEQGSAGCVVADTVSEVAIAEAPALADCVLPGQGGAGEQSQACETPAGALAGVHLGPDSLSASGQGGSLRLAEGGKPEGSEVRAHASHDAPDAGFACDAEPRDLDAEMLGNSDDALSCHDSHSPVEGEVLGNMRASGELGAAPAELGKSGSHSEEGLSSGTAEHFSPAKSLSEVQGEDGDDLLDAGDDAGESLQSTVAQCSISAELLDSRPTDECETTCGVLAGEAMLGEEVALATSAAVGTAAATEAAATVDQAESGICSRRPLSCAQPMQTWAQQPRSSPASAHRLLPQPSDETRRHCRSRSPLRRSQFASPMKRLPRRFVILDGMNILRSRNCLHTSSEDALRLEWGQLESACAFYAKRRFCVSVFLPPLRVEHEPELRRLRNLFGDVFVLCPGGGSSDDKFMINAVKSFEEDERTEFPDADRIRCHIITNDGFKDWQQVGLIDAKWVEGHCIRYAFCPLGFVPGELL